MAFELTLPSHSLTEKLPAIALPSPRTWHATRQTKQIEPMGFIPENNYQDAIDDNCDAEIVGQVVQLCISDDDECSSGYCSSDAAMSHTTLTASSLFSYSMNSSLKHDIWESSSSSGRSSAASSVNGDDNHFCVSPTSVIKASTESMWGTPPRVRHSHVSHETKGQRISAFLESAAVAPASASRSNPNHFVGSPVCYAAPVPQPMVQAVSPLKSQPAFQRPAPPSNENRQAAGTGVFLPRTAAQLPTQSPSRPSSATNSPVKKSNPRPSATVYLPARLVHAFGLHVDEQNNILVSGGANTPSVASQLSGSPNRGGAYRPVIKLAPEKNSRGSPVKGTRTHSSSHSQAVNGGSFNGNNNNNNRHGNKQQKQHVRMSANAHQPNKPAAFGLPSEWAY